MALSRNDVEKLFTSLCPALLLEQAGEDTRVGNVARSWSVLKTALRLWLYTAIGPDDDRCYRVFVADIGLDAHSLFRQALKLTLESYQPILDAYKKRRREAAMKHESKPLVSPPFSRHHDLIRYVGGIVVLNGNLWDVRRADGTTTVINHLV